jgi:hypothetical protein
LEQIAGISSYFVIPGREASTEYKPYWTGKIFRRTVQDFTLSLVSLYRMYSVLVIRPRLNCIRVETGLRSSPPPPISYPFVLIYSWWPGTLTYDRFNNCFMFKCLMTSREMENLRGPTFEDFVSILTEGSRQDITVARLQSTRVQTPPLLNVMNCVRVSLRTVKLFLAKVISTYL